MRFLSSLLLLLFVSRTLACGGFFCSFLAPVRQAAERILFAVDEDSTVTAHVQISYVGEAQKFSWVLPLPSVRHPEEIGLQKVKFRQ